MLILYNYVEKKEIFVYVSLFIYGHFDLLTRGSIMLINACFFTIGYLQTKTKRHECAV